MTHMLKRFWPVTVVAILLIILIPVYMAREVIREPAVYWVTTKLYAPKINEVQAESFDTINKELEKIGVTLDTIDRAHCYNGSYKFIRETVICRATNSVSNLEVTPALETAWPDAAKVIQSHLKNNDWRQTNLPPTIPLAERLESSADIQIFQKIQGKTTCLISFSVDTSPTSQRKRLFITESCERKVHIFGGHQE